MGYSKDIYEQAMNVLNERRATEQAQAEERKQAFYQQYPRAQEIETQLASTAIAAAKAVLRSGNTRETLTKLRKTTPPCRRNCGNFWTRLDFRRTTSSPTMHVLYARTKVFSTAKCAAV